MRIDNLICVSGTAPISFDGSTACKGDIYAQTKRCQEIIAKAIQDVGGELGNVIRTRIMLTDMNQWQKAAKAYGEFITDIRPACTFVEVSRFIDPDWLVEVEADCTANSP